MTTEEAWELAEGRSRTVSKANELIQKSRYNLNPQQQKIILYLISKIKPDDEEFKIYEYDLKDFCSICGITYNGKNYENIKNSIKELADKSFWITEGKKEMLFRWMERVELNKGETKVSMRFDDRLKPYLLNLKKNYTFYELSYTLLMKSKYSLRLYEVLKSYAYLGFYEVELEEFKKLLDCDNAGYDRYNNLRQWVIDKALEEINLYTDLEVDYQPIRIGRAVGKLAFTIQKKDDYEEVKTRLIISAELNKNK